MRLKAGFISLILLFTLAWTQEEEPMDPGQEGDPEVEDKMLTGCLGNATLCNSVGGTCNY